MPTLKIRVIRALIHVPLGLLQGYASRISWNLSLTFCLCFLTYEVIEDWRIHDKSFNDILGYLIGLGAYIVIRLLGWCE